MQFIDAHKKVSRLVIESDLETVLKDAEEMVPLLNTQIGRYASFFAIAHPQVEKDRPLRFFVINPATSEFRAWRSIAILNPVILRHTNNTTDSEEGCATFSTMPAVIVPRWTKCEVEFSPLEFDENKKPRIGRRITFNLSGKIAKVFQHEIDHLNAKYIYD